MFVYMKKDLEKIGIAGQVIKVKSGFAKNFLIPHGFAVEVQEKEHDAMMAKSKHVSKEKVILDSKISMLAERIKNLHITVAKKVHDDDRLYASLSAEDIVEALKEKEISINKKQVDFQKSVKTLGDHTVTIKLSSKFKPELNLKVVNLS